MGAVAKYEMPSEIILQLLPDEMIVLNGRLAGSPETAIDATVRGYGDALIPLHAGAKEPVLNRTLSVPVRDHGRSLVPPTQYILKTKWRR